MKLRIRGNSVRLRLSKGDVARLEETGLIEETIEFGFDSAQKFAYALAAGGDRVRAVFENNRLAVFMPSEQARAWARGAEIGVSAEQPLADDKTLRILVEKDFSCLDERPGEDESDLFANPAGKIC